MFVLIDCFSGISGDMFLAGLIGLGFPLDILQECFVSSGLNIQINSQIVDIQGIQSRSINVCEKFPPIRNLTCLKRLIAETPLPDVVKEKSLYVFHLLAEAEAQVHGVSVEQVHFHEIGSADTLVDIVGVIYGLNYLGINDVFCASVPWSDGLIKMQHGLYPGPAPATALLLQGIPCHGVKSGIELVTPTGAALLKALNPKFQLLPPFRPEKIAYGAGSMRRKDSVPNVLRLVLGQRFQANLQTEVIAVLETIIDDMSGEHYTFLCEMLQKDPDIIDVYTTPVIMKKGRPGFLLTALTPSDLAARVSSLIILHSTSNGVRCSYQSRLIAERRFKSISSPWGSISVKSVLLPDGQCRFKPEYEDCKRIALENDLPITQVYQYALKNTAEVPCKE